MMTRMKQKQVTNLPQSCFRAFFNITLGKLFSGSGFLSTLFASVVGLHAGISIILFILVKNLY